MNNEMNDKIQKFCEAWADVDVSAVSYTHLTLPTIA